jgi:hypothetical protein
MIDSTCCIRGARHQCHGHFITVITNNEDIYVRDQYNNILFVSLIYYFYPQRLCFRLEYLRAFFPHLDLGSYIQTPGRSTIRAHARRLATIEHSTYASLAFFFDFPKIPPLLNLHKCSSSHVVCCAFAGPCYLRRVPHM